MLSVPVKLTSCVVVGVDVTLKSGVVEGLADHVKLRSFVELNDAEYVIDSDGDGVFVAELLSS